MAKKHYKFDKILWLDLEMTGLSPEKDLILEVAAIVTDWKLEELKSFEATVRQPKSKLRNRLGQNRAFWDNNANTRDSLLKQNDSGQSLKQVELDLLSFIGDNFSKSQPILLAGNSIHMDRRFIANYWPKLDSRLYYRMLDVSSLKVVFENNYHKTFAKPEEHRALGDIRGSIAELEYYLKFIKV